MYFPDNLAGLVVLSERVARVAARSVQRHRR
jgi:hypothetical protein